MELFMWNYLDGPIRWKDVENASVRENELLTPPEIRLLSLRAVNILVSDSKSGRLDENKSLAEVIAGCIRHTEPRIMKTLIGLLDEREQQ